MHYLDYNEKIDHGTPDFPIAFYHVDEHHSRYNMPFHWHKEMELIQILSGSLRLYLDDEEINAGAGDVILIGEGIIHGGVPEHCVYECAVLDLNPTLMHTDARRGKTGIPACCRQPAVFLTRYVTPMREAS